MSDCTYKLTLPDGQERTIIGKAAMKAFLVEEGMSLFYPNGFNPNASTLATPDLNAMFNDVLAEEIAKDEAKVQKQRAPKAPSKPRTASQAAASAAKNTAAALVNAIDGLGALFGQTPPTDGTINLNSGIPVKIDAETYAKAKPLFQQAIANLGDAGSDLKEAMRAVVRMVLDKFGIQAARNMQPYVVQFIEDVQNERQATNGEQDVPSATDNLESDSSQPGTERAVVYPVQGDAGAVPGNAGSSGGPANRETGSGQPGGAGLSAGGAAAGGERGDFGVYRGDPAAVAARVASGADFSERGSDVGFDGVRNDPIPAAEVDRVAVTSNDRLTKERLQLQADATPVKPGDLENVKTTLPYLLEGQQEDVFKAETRFAKPDGYGMLFTNGTGTGKTFTGLGVVKRMARQGKGNILIVVPDEKIMDDWRDSGKALGLNITPLADTKDAGKGLVVTTYANLGQNDALARRQWDMVVADEAHELMKSADGKVTTYLANLRAITHHPDGASQRHTMLNRKDIDALAKISEQITAHTKILNNTDTMEEMMTSVRAENARLQKEADALAAKLRKASDAVRSEVASMQGDKRARLLALSATPFAYEFTVDWANGYLFDYNEGQASDRTEFRGYNQGSNKDRFFMTHFGYSMRYNKLTKPDPSKVDTGLLQRNFNTHLRKTGALSSRMLDVQADYDRRFVLVDSAIGNQIDDALNWISEKRREANKENMGFATLSDLINEKFDHLSRRYLLEAIKATEVVPIVRQHMALGRKVVVFHDYKKGGGFNPFDIKVPGNVAADATPEQAQAFNDFRAAVSEFRSQFRTLVNAPLGTLDSPIEVFKREFPDVLLVNGDEKKSALLDRYKKFQDDASGPQVMLVQSAKNKGWSGHDTTGKHQRVLINLGQPTAPTTAIQQEGRIYRTGQVTDAIMRYLNTGTSWEKTAFAQTIAGRASAAENLGMGEQARALKDSFISAFEESDSFPPGHDGEGKGGKARDKLSNAVLTAYDRAKTYYWSTQKKNSKTKAQEGKDYFATPEPVGYKMAEWLDLRGGESSLEPSAGHGAIARWLPENTNRTAIEPSNPLRARLAMAMDASRDRLVDGAFEEHAIVNKYDGIAMNPPFGAGGKTAIEHLAKAATHLRDGGRIVALIPTGPAADKRFDQWMYGESERPSKPLYIHPQLGVIYKGDTVSFYDANGNSGTFKIESGGRYEDWRKGVDPEYNYFKGPQGATAPVTTITKVEPTGPRTETYRAAENLYMVGEVKLPSATFERAGTNVATRIVIIDKQTDGSRAPQQTRNIDLSNATDIKELFDRLEEMSMPARVMTQAQQAQAPSQPTAPQVKTPKAANPDAVGTVDRGDAEIIEHITKKGKTLRGIVKTDLLREEAEKIDPFTFRKDGGWFIRQEYLKPEGADAATDAPKFSRTSGTDQTDTAAFKPAQVKSATGNNGNFDPANPDIRFSFAGQQAATADTMALATAQQRLEAGEDAEAVRRDTGWFRGVDGKWRFEINDADARLKDRAQWTAKIDGINAKRDAALQALWQAEEQRNDFLRARGESPSRISSETKKTPEFKALAKALKNAEAAAEKAQDAAFLARQGDSLITVGDVLSHPALFAAYPGIANVRVDINDSLPAGNAAYAYELRAIELSGKSDAQQLLSTLLHEIQHGIQHIESFAMGGSTDRMREYSIEHGRKIVEAEYGDLPSYKKAKEEGRLDAWVMTAMQASGKGISPYEAYRRLAGEVEARNTQARQNLTDAQRRATPPSQTADVADSDVIVMFNGKVAMSAPTPANAAPDAAPQPPRTPAATIRAAINRAYGKLLGQLEAKGLVTLAQTEAQAIEAAAQARADKTGGDVGAIRAELMESVKQSAAMRLWVGSRTVNDAIIPETPEYAGSTTGDLAYVPEGAKIPAGPLRITVGTAPERHRGRGITHMADNAKNDARRMPKNETGNLTEDLMREAVAVMSGATQVHNDGSYIFVNPSMKKAIVANYINGFYSVTSVRPYSGDPTALWGTPEWRGRLAFPSRETAAASPSATDRQDSLPRPDRAGLEVHSEKFDLTNSADETQATTPVVTIKKRRTIDIKRSANGAVQGFFDPQTGQSFLIADNLSAEAAPGVLMHEVGIHMAADGTMQPLFDRATRLLKAQNGNPFMQRVQARMDAAKETSGEEAAAYIVEAYENDRSQAPASVRKLLGDLLAAVKAWLYQKGFMDADRLTVADIAAVARANAKSISQGDTEGGMKFSRADGIGPTQTENFKRWFGDSKVVDADGKPLVVYHGTYADFTQFMRRPPGRKQDGLDSIGSWFTDNPARAADYGSAVVPAYVSIKNPLVLDSFQDLRDLWHDAQPTRGPAAKAHKENRHWGSSEAFLDEWSSLYDGIIIKSHGNGEWKDQSAYIAFRSEQIKSATGNNGDFDPANPDIRFSRKAPDDTTPQPWQAPSLEDTSHKFAWDNMTYALQDKLIDTKRVVQAIQQAGGELKDQTDVYLQEELYHARVSHKSQEFVQKELTPMVQALASKGIELADFERYLHARHAPEANRVMKERNPNEAEIEAKKKVVYAQLQALGSMLKDEDAPAKEKARVQRLFNQMAGKLELLAQVKPWQGSEEDRQKLSGMSDDEARTVMAALSPEQARDMPEVAAMFDSIVKKNRQEMVDYELEDQGTVDGWGQMFEFYVPLMREDEGNSQGTGQGFSIKGRETKSRTGSTRKVVDIVANLAMQRERLIVRGEKNRVSQALVGLASANPNPDFWQVGAPDMERKYDPRTNSVKLVADPNYKNRDNVVTAKLRGADGKVSEVAVVFNEDDNRAKRMAESLKNLDGQTLEGLWEKSATITRYLAAMSTQYNPIFGVINLARDLQGAAVNLAGTPLADKKGKIAWQAKNALLDIYRAARADRKNEAHSGEWTQWWDMFQEDGGPTGYRDIFKDSNERTKAITNTMSPDAWMESAFGKVVTANGLLKDPMRVMENGRGWMFGWLSDYNLAMENAIRVSTYRAAIESGMTRERAASLAKNITVNFNRKGQMALKAGALYAFFNAAVQGNARLAQTLFTMDPGKPKTIRLSPLGKKVVAGGVLLGALQAVVMAVAGFEDENPPDFVRERNFILPTGWGRFLTSPMPLGLHILPGIGRHLTEFALSGGKEPQKRAIDMFAMIFDSVYPFGSAGWSLQTLFPTLIDPIIALAENKDYAGRAIARESIDPNVPGHELTRTTATWTSMAIAEAINWMTGGNKYVAGKVSPTPDQIDYLIGQATGGVGREILKAVQTGQAIYTGEELPAHKIPLFGRFFGSANGGASQAGPFYAKVTEAKRLDRQIDGLREDGQTAKAMELQRSNAYLLAKARVADSQVTRLRREKRQLLEKGAPRAQIQEVERRMGEAMRRFNEATAK